MILLLYMVFVLLAVLNLAPLDAWVLVTYPLVVGVFCLSVKPSSAGAPPSYCAMGTLENDEGFTQRTCRKGVRRVSRAVAAIVVFFQTASSQMCVHCWK